MISDEQLSAFLDAELPEAEMEAIRDQLAEDETLSDRLAELAQVDQVVRLAYSTIDTRPIPAAVTQLLADDQRKPANIIAFPSTKLRAPVWYAAAAAVLVIAVSVGLLPRSQNTEWQAVTKVLETSPSGVQTTAGLTDIKPKLSFINQQGAYCRLFELQNKSGASENIACRINQEWQKVASAPVTPSTTGELYQPASGGSPLDATLEEMAKGDFFDKEAEAKAIAERWGARR